jgi:hypothetical protein
MKSLRRRSCGANAVPAFALLCAVSSALLAGSAAYAGPIWDDDLTEDAEALPAGAQVVTTAVVGQIRGKLSGNAFMGGGDFVDMYAIQITQPLELKFSTGGAQTGGGSAQFDSRLFLFRASGTGVGGDALAVFANDDAFPGNPGSFIGSQANDGSGFILQKPGIYYIAITVDGINALNANGGQIFESIASPGTIAFGNFEKFGGWGGQPGSNGGDYIISVQGIAGIPAPGALALLGMAGVLGRGRRRA